MPQTSNRLIGIDVAYTVALFGCVVYGFSFTIGDWVLRTLTHTKFGIILDCFPALFFFLNGFTITLTMRDRRISNRKLLSINTFIKILVIPTKIKLLSPVDALRIFAILFHPQIKVIYFIGKLSSERKRSRGAFNREIDTSNRS